MPHLDGATQRPTVFRPNQTGICNNIGKQPPPMLIPSRW